LDPIRDYLKRIERALAEGNATEHTHRPALKVVLEALGPGLIATNEPRRVQCGAPDFVISRPTKHGPLTVGYLEAKDVGKSLDEAEHSEQMSRYLPALGNLVLTDYLEFRWYVNGEQRLVGRLAKRSKGGRLSPNGGGIPVVQELLKGFLEHRPEPLTSPRELAERMARLAHIIRDIIVADLEAGTASGLLRDVKQAFVEVLIPDLSDADFADMFAQTVAYGLFAARCNHAGPDPFQRAEAAAEIPKTNPFLRRLFATITGPDLEDEPFAGFVTDLAQLLADTDIKAVLADFGKRTGRGDPVVHFYETFLAAYDPKLRQARGVYYTPAPVVSYIVGSVDHLLKSIFECHGLADTSEIELPRRKSDGKEQRAKSPRVLILDPACGTGTFLYAVVDSIREEFASQGRAGEWSGYVRQHLLPRLFGLELLMAPYAVAHLKLGMQLAGFDLPEAQRPDWAYDFAGSERIGIYLTNTLEEAAKKSELLIGRYISEEANAAAHLKRDLPIMVVLGNPPYSGHSANRSWEIRDGKKVLNFIGRLLKDYYEVDGAPLGERNPKWLQDDYVKFLRFGQWRIEETGSGVLAFITNHSYLDNPTFRGMRQQLLRAFTDIYLLDLHGSAKKSEQPPGGGPDENVFDIQQGVAIGLFVRRPQNTGRSRVYHADLWGTRDEKYGWLSASNVESTDWKEIAPTSPLYLFIPQDTDLRAEYEGGWKVTEIMPVNVLGFQTHRDDFAVAFDEPTLRARISDLRSPSKSDEEVRALYDLHDNRDWKLAASRQTIRRDSDWTRHIVRCEYRPFDWRPCCFSEVAMDYPRRELLENVAGRENLCLNTVRQTKMETWQHALVSDAPAPAVFVELKDGSTVFPLYLYASDTQDLWSAVAPPGSLPRRRPNLAPEFIRDVEARLHFTFVPDGAGDLRSTFGPEDVFAYVYAILNCAQYQERYFEFLRTDFPRVPLTTDVEAFRLLVAKGAELAIVQLLRSPSVPGEIAKYPESGPDVVEGGHPRYLAPGETVPGSAAPLSVGRVYISEDDLGAGKKAQFFEGVAPDVWNFTVGGYQVCEKWLKDRRGRRLTYDDFAHYEKIVAAIQQTLRLKAEIDAVVIAHGGFPLTKAAMAVANVTLLEVRPTQLSRATTEEPKRGRRKPRPREKKR
jgi:hypothetical protein